MRRTSFVAASAASLFILPRAARAAIPPYAQPIPGVTPAAATATGAPASGAAPGSTTEPAPADKFETAYDLATASGTIYGTLRLPDGTARPPVVLVIAGSGPTDRNGNAPQLKLDIYRKLAKSLSEAGIASVRYDKRGIAASRASGPTETDLRFGTYVDDAAAWIAKLRADARFSRVVVAGHSEGSLVGMIAARKASAHAYVSLEGAGFPAALVLKRQLAPRLAQAPDLLTKANQVIDRLSANALVPEAEVPPELLGLFRPSVQPYLQSWFALDPRAEIAKLTGPVTIVQGTHDVQVGVTDGRALQGAHPSARFVLAENMTHVLVDDPGTTFEAQAKTAYANAALPLDPVAVRAVVTAAGK